MPLLPANTTPSASFGHLRGNSGFSLLLISEFLHPSLFPPPVRLTFSVNNSDMKSPESQIPRAVSVFFLDE